ncbi:MAG: NAD-dependent epimerase/dehydratase family protein [Sediminibacterium sp.]
MILVTGATGLVGTHLVNQLISEGKMVRALYRSGIPARDIADKVQWIKGDILDIVSLGEAMQDVKQVYHCAAVVSFHAQNKQLIHQTNMEGTANIVNTCLDAGVEKLLFVSSVAALGRIRQTEMINETMNWSEETSNSEYGKSKYLAEMEVWRGIGEGLNAVMVNPVIILGRGDWEHGSSGIFKSAYHEFPWYTEGTTGFVDVLDVVRAMIALMESDISAQRFILSSGDLSYREVFTQIAKEFNKRPPYKKVTPFLASLVWRIEAVKGMITGKQPLLTRETSHTAQTKARFDNSKLKRYLPWFTYTPVDASIRRICQELKLQYGLK